MHSGGAHRSTNSRNGENAGEAFFLGFLWLVIGLRCGRTYAMTLLSCKSQF